MNLYKTQGEIITPDDSNIVTRWAGSQAEASKQRVAMKKDSFKGVGTEEVDVPTGKVALLAWLNANAV